MSACMPARMVELPAASAPAVKDRVIEMVAVVLEAGVDGETLSGEDGETLS